MTPRRIVGAALLGIGLALGVAGMWGGFGSPAAAASVVPAGDTLERVVTFDQAPQADTGRSYRGIAQDGRDCPNEPAPDVTSPSDL